MKTFHALLELLDLHRQIGIGPHVLLGQLLHASLHRGEILPLRSIGTEVLDLALNICDFTMEEGHIFARGAGEGRDGKNDNQDLAHGWVLLCISGLL